MRLSNPDKEKLRKELDSIGENLAREKLAQGIFDKNQTPFVESWLKSKDDERSLVASTKRDAREEETLRIAKSANRLAIIAIIITTIFSILSTIIAIIALRI